MIDKKEFIRMERELEALLAEKFGQSSGPIELRLKRGLRRAPRVVRRAAEGFAQAHVQASHPKLMRLMDAAKVEEQFQTLRVYLRGVDVTDRRKGLLLSVLGSVSFNLLVIVALLIGFLIWRGFL